MYQSSDRFCATSSFRRVFLLSPHSLLRDCSHIRITVTPGITQNSAAGIRSGLVETENAYCAPAHG